MIRAKHIVSISLLTLVLVGCSKESAEEPAGPGATEAQTSVEESNTATVKTETPAQADEVAAPSPAVVATTPAEEPENAMAETGDAAAGPQTHIVKGVITQWQPLVTFAQPGDTIKFTNMAGHDTVSMEGMIPEGATPWQSKLGEEAFTITVDKEGAYVYKCNPHITTGMVGIIVVGDRNPANLAELEANAGNVKIGGNMVKRAIRKMKKQLESS